MRATIKNGLSLAERAAHLMSRARGVSIETRLDPYLQTVSAIRARELASRPDDVLRECCREL